jgi:signal transduction histidine kinase
MTVPESTGKPPARDAAAGNADPKEGNARQIPEIDHLRAENLASRAENSGLRETALADGIAIGDLKKARSQIDSLYRDLQARNRALEAANKELESFSYAVSHDLRSPLRSIHGFSEALAQSAAAKLSPEENSWLLKISDAAARMDRLTEDLLRLSRITRSQLKREPVDLALLARQVVHELRQTDPHRDVVFAISDSLGTHADPGLMRVALTNLLGNAWKYTGRRHQALISFGQEELDGQKVFYVRDNGPDSTCRTHPSFLLPFRGCTLRASFPAPGSGLRVWPG